ncbi:MAG: hypothetical protein ACYDAL_04710 [Candidatus Dormibacteraceae bacterium]
MSARAVEIIRFESASINEKDSRIGAFEVLINRYSGALSRPNMMWNTANGMMARGGMMGVVAQPNTAMTVSKERATSIAQNCLDRNVNGATTRTRDL